jgi:hypothetical protein
VAEGIGFLYWRQEMYMTLVGYKGLPQGSVLSPFLYNIIGSCADRFISSGCGFLQYADDLVVYDLFQFVKNISFFLIFG